jgi:hypothetical protein
MDATVDIPVVALPDHDFRVHVIPTGDTHLHAAQMSCWCFPTDTEKGLVVHNAKDCREVRQRGTYDFQNGWTPVAEYFIPDPA